MQYRPSLERKKLGKLYILVFEKEQVLSVQAFTAQCKANLIWYGKIFENVVDDILWSPRQG
jgi:hypothetical protein